MGLLSRAGNCSVSVTPSLDEMGKALLERLRMLPQEKSTAVTILTLLKAYGAFQGGLCLSLKDDEYTAYASAGLGGENTVIPRDRIHQEEHAGKKFFKLDAEIFPEFGSHGMSGGNNYAYWAFPIDAQTLMILSENSPAFNPEPVSIILEDVARKIIPLEEQAGREKTETMLQKQIRGYNKMYAVFNCIILENPFADEDADRITFLQKVTETVGVTGTVLALSSDRPLILLPESMDRELIAHRLSKTLNTRPLLSFNADSPENVFEHLQSLI